MNNGRLKSRDIVDTIVLIDIDPLMRTMNRLELTTFDVHHRCPFKQHLNKDLLQSAVDDRKIMMVNAFIYCSTSFIASFTFINHRKSENFLNKRKIQELIDFLSD